MVDRSWAANMEFVVTESLRRYLESHPEPVTEQFLQGAAMHRSQVAEMRLTASRQVAALAQIYTFHVGEHETLNLCMTLPDALLLTDDTAARVGGQNAWHSQRTAVWGC